MNTNTFNRLVEDQFKVCKEILAKKGREYAPDSGDRLQAFKTAAKLQHKTPIQALGGQMSKHTISLYEMIENNSKDLSLWQEKIIDSTNYLFLLHALILETHPEAQK
jgi:hypothetical protein